MIVLIDMEWIETKRGIFCPTQIAAIRVNENWVVVDQYASLIKPYNTSCFDWKHVAYSGANPGAFLTAKSAHGVFEDLERWFKPDDKVCWWHPDALIKYEKLVKVILNQKTNAQSYVIGKRIKPFLNDGFSEKGNPYALAQARSIPTPEPEHCSMNDVEVMRLLLASVVPEQQALLVGAKIHKQKEIAVQQPLQGKVEAQGYKPGLHPYWWEEKKNVIHADGCSHLNQIKAIKGIGTIERALKHQAKPCSCIIEEYRKAAIVRNTGILDRCQYNYVYASNSPVFHRYDCRIVRGIYTGVLLGSVHYDACVQTGRKPCRICNPIPYANRNSELKQSSTTEQKAPSPQPKPFYQGANRNLKSAEQLAYKRYTQARAERHSLDSSIKLKDEELQDFLTLTQPRYAFWAGCGYGTFHLRHCPKLNGLKEIKGFALYQDATRAGLTPCKHCKPSVKHQITVSIPISNHVRNHETLGTLDAFCDAVGYGHQYDNPYYIITTPVGKWRLDVHARPVTVEHINLVTANEYTQFHQQPRIFLSLTDTFNYILRHDQSLEEKQKIDTLNNCAWSRI